jgi:hypothetical protein
MKAPRFPARLATIFFFGLLVCIACGCPHRLPDLDPSLRITDAEELLDAMKTKGGLLSSLRASGTVLMRRDAKRVKAHMLVLVRRPANLRFETESFFDQPISILVTDGMRFSLWDMDKGRFLVGPATPANISRVIPIPMDGPDVVGIMAGDPPMIAYARSSLTWDESENQYRLVLSNSRQEQTILVHPVRLRPSHIRCREGGKLLYRLDYSDWQDRKEGPSVPREVVFEMPADDIKLRVRLRNTEINVPLADEMFELHPPEGLPIEQLVEAE